MLIDNAMLAPSAEWLEASFAVTVKADIVAGPLGVPLITPELAFKLSPAGSAPVEIVQVLRCRSSGCNNRLRIRSCNRT
jgi:hypothetical protein